MVSLCSKLYCSADVTEEKTKFSAKGIQKRAMILAIKSLYYSMIK
jgi:hypothetical protein